jgi:primosomal protein N'
MHVISVVPIIRGTMVDELSYFTIRPVAVGDVVTVPIRGSEQPALVVRIELVEDAKSTLRTQHFELQKMGAAAPTPLLSSTFLNACVRAAPRFAASAGAVIHSIVPAVLFDERPTLQAIHAAPQRPFQQYALQDTYENRVAIYKNIARECIAKQESLLIITAQRVTAEALFTKLSHGIDRHVKLMHGGISRKKMVANWTEQDARTEATIMIGTPQCMAAPLHKLTTIIIERESDQAYTLFERPHVDVRVLATEYARALGARIIFADTMLRVATHTECDRAEREYYMPPLHKVRTDCEVTVFHKDQTERGHVLSKELYTALAELIDRKKKILVVVARKGIATAVYCTDCGSRFLTHHSSRALAVATPRTRTRHALRAIVGN